MFCGLGMMALCPYSAYLRGSVQKDTSEFNAGSNSAMD